MPALATLAVVVAASCALAHRATARTVGPAPRAMQTHAITTGITAAVFWVWAIANCAINRSFDLGAASFFTVLVSSVGQFKKASANSPVGSQRWYTCGSCGFVVLNYTLGLALISSNSQRLYFGVAAVVWLAAGAFGWHLCQRYEAGRSAAGASQRQERMLVGS
jgi:hypothetical protein